MREILLILLFDAILPRGFCTYLICFLEGLVAFVCLSRLIGSLYQCVNKVFMKAPVFFRRFLVLPTTDKHWSMYDGLETKNCI